MMERDSHSLLQGVFPTQGSNPDLSHWRYILYCLSYQESPKNTGVGCHFLLQGIFLTQGLNPGLPHHGQILSHLSHQGSPIKQIAFPTLEIIKLESLRCCISSGRGSIQTSILPDFIGFFLFIAPCQRERFCWGLCHCCIRRENNRVLLVPLVNFYSTLKAKSHPQYLSKNK